MADTTGSHILARQLANEGVEDMFYLMGGPIIQAAGYVAEQGIRTIDVRHEQAAAMAAHGYARVKGTVGVCMAASGPATTNLLTGVANAYLDGIPLVALGGAASFNAHDQDEFQEYDQLTMAKPVSRWAGRVTHTYRMAEYINMAFRKAQSPKPGPAYLDLPGDTLYGKMDEDRVQYPRGNQRPFRASPDPRAISDAITMLKGAKRPLIVTGTGIHFSGASEELLEFIDTARVPIYTTPQGRGVVPEDHELSFLGSRSQAFKECDVLLAVGTRFNFVIGQGKPPRWDPDLKVIHVDIDGSEIGHNRAADIGIISDAKLALAALTAEAKQQGFVTAVDWHARLREADVDQRNKSLELAESDSIPIHPMRVMNEVAQSLDRDAVLCVDGNETLSFARQWIPSFVPGARINAGPNGCMGTGLPFALGAQVAAPGRQVLALVGDGSFLMNVQEIDTMVRHNLPVVIVVSNNGGWTGMANTVAGRSLGFNQKYEQIAEALGGYGQFVEKPDEIRPAIERAYASGRPSVVHVHVQEHATATTASYGGYSSMQIR